MKSWNRNKLKPKELLVWLRLQKGCLVPKMRHENSECSRIHPKASIKILKDRVQEKSTLDLQEWRWEEWKNCMHSHNSQLSQLSEVPSHYLLYDSFSFFSPSVQWPCIQSPHDPTPMPQTTQEIRNNSNSNQTSLYCSEYIVRITQEHKKYVQTKPLCQRWKCCCEDCKHVPLPHSLSRLLATTWGRRTDLRIKQYPHKNLHGRQKTVVRRELI